MGAAIPDFSIVIPLYNEEDCVEKSVTEIIRGLDRDFGGAYEVILVINGSQDRTSEICERLAGCYPCIRTVSAERNLGYGGGIIAGLGTARGEYVGFMCGDGQVSPEDLANVMREIATGSWDLVKARRVSRADGIVRRLNSLAYNGLFWLLLGTRSRDINAMPKLWRRGAMPLIDPTSTDWFIDAEIMVKARYRRLRIREVPVRYLERIGGRSVVRVSTVFQFLRNAVAATLSGKLREWKRPPAGAR